MISGDKLIVGAVATVIGVNMIGGCSRNREAKAVAEWENSQGTQGFINLNDVRDAFRATQEMAAFEKRVNELFEGDNLIVFEAKEVSKGFKLLAREDLDGSKSTTSKDDLLFTLSVQGRTVTLQGAGVNKFYKETWIYEVPADAQQRVQEVHNHSSFASSPFFWWWVLSPGWGGYYTPYTRYDSIYAHRTQWRTTSGYRSQTTRNAKYADSMNSKYGKSFRSAVNSSTPQRSSYIKKQASSKSFKEKLKASSRKTGSATKSQMRSSVRTSRTFSSTSRSSSSSRTSSSRSYGGFSGSSGFGI